jgi:hypothetical protein
MLSYDEFRSLVEQDDGRRRLGTVKDMLNSNLDQMLV